MSYKRADRVNALLQRELGTIISEELRDPRIAFSTVTAVEITDEGVTIGEAENTAKLTHAEWNDLIARVRSGELREV